MKTANEIYAGLQAKWCEITGVKEGSYVKVTRKCESKEQGWSNSWASKMDDTVDKIGRVSDITEDNINITFPDYTNWAYPYFVLEVAEAPKKVVKLGDRTLTFENDVVTVGCCKLRKAQAKKVISEYKNLRGTFKSYNFSMVIEGTTLNDSIIDEIDSLIS